MHQIRTATSCPAERPEGSLEGAEERSPVSNRDRGSLQLTA